MDESQNGYFRVLSIPIASHDSGGETGVVTFQIIYLFCHVGEGGCLDAVSKEELSIR